MIIISLLFELNKQEYINLNDSLIISKFILLMFLTDWINMNSILEFSNEIALYLGKNRTEKSNKIEAKSNKKNSNNENWQSLFTQVAGLKILLFYLLFIHIFCCSWIYILYRESEGILKNNWMNKFDIEISLFDLYIISFYYILTTLLSVGYGDITPVNNYERVFVIFFMLVCAFFYSFLITLISFLYSKKETKLMIFSEKENLLKEINEEYHLKQDLYKKIDSAIEHYTQDWKNDKLIFIENLPRNIKLTIQSSVFKNIRNCLCYFDKIQNEPFIFEVCHLFKSQLYEKNTFLIQEGSLFQEIYFILKGEILIMLSEKYENFPLSIIKASETFGDYLIENSKLSPFTLKTTRSNNEILTLSDEHYKKIKEKYPDEVEECKLSTSFISKLIEELRLGAMIYYDLYGNLNNYKNFTSVMINHQINKELDFEPLKKKSALKNVNDNLIIPELKRFSEMTEKTESERHIQNLNEANNTKKFKNSPSRFVSFVDKSNMIKVDNKPNKNTNNVKLFRKSFIADRKFHNKLARMRGLKNIISNMNIASKKLSSYDLCKKEFSSKVDNSFYIYESNQEQFNVKTDERIKSISSMVNKNVIYNKFDIIRSKKFNEDTFQLVYYNNIKLQQSKVPLTNTNLKQSVILNPINEEKKLSPLLKDSNKKQFNSKKTSKYYKAFKDLGGRRRSINIIINNPSFYRDKITNQNNINNINNNIKSNFKNYNNKKISTKSIIKNSSKSNNVLDDGLEDIERKINQFSKSNIKVNFALESENTENTGKLISTSKYLSKPIINLLTNYIKQSLNN